MSLDDPKAGAESVEPLWHALAGRLAVAAGAATAVIALLHDVPVSRACLRGGLAWFAASLLARGCERLLGWVYVPPPPPEEEPADDEPALTDAPTP